MFSKKITESDSFLTLSLPAQALYLHLNMSADDDGIVLSPKRVISMSCGDIDQNGTDNVINRMKQLKEAYGELIKQGFLVEIDGDVVAIKHWQINNIIRRDRYSPSPYKDELDKIKSK